MKYCSIVVILSLFVGCAPQSVSVSVEKGAPSPEEEEEEEEEEEVPLPDSDEPEIGEIDCDLAPYVSWDNWIEGALSAHCQGCHASTSIYRYGAPEHVSFDTEADTLEWLSRIEARVLNEQTMPPAGGMLPEELVLFDIWIRCWN